MTWKNRLVLLIELVRGLNINTNHKAFRPDGFESFFTLESVSSCTGAEDGPADPPVAQPERAVRPPDFAAGSSDLDGGYSVS